MEINMRCWRKCFRGTVFLEEKELYDGEINSGAFEKGIYELVTTAKEKWNMEILQRYLDILLRINGFENGNKNHGHLQRY
ncbi:MAG: hypothetical protein SO415_07620 [Oliverpabstia sp.]|nr:hypothetical protein [Oliverpabstia sp.]